jgi:signal transduction histidine kinase
LKAWKIFFGARWGETVEIQTVVAEKLWSTCVDVDQFANVVLNPAINARDAMPIGGRLTLELANAVLDDRHVTGMPDVPAGQYVMLAVTDTGAGMPPEVAERIFEPFSRRSRKARARAWVEHGLRFREAERGTHPCLQRAG